MDVLVSLFCICFLLTLRHAKGPRMGEMLVKDWTMGDLSEADTGGREGAITPAGLVDISF